MGEFYWQQAISPIASRENQLFSAVTGATEVMALNERPGYTCLPRCKHACFPIDNHNSCTNSQHIQYRLRTIKEKLLTGM